MTTYYLECIADPTKKFKNPDGTTQVGEFKKGTKLTSIQKLATTYRVGTIYVRQGQVKLLPSPPPPPPPVDQPTSAILMTQSGKEYRTTEFQEIAGTSTGLSIQVSTGGRFFKANLEEISQGGATDTRGVFQVRSAVDPVVIALQGIAEDSNFAPIKLAGFDSQNAVDFNAIKKFQRVNYDYLRSLQFAEPEKEYGSIDLKMKWLVNHEGVGKRPYWVDGTRVNFGTILFGSQLVKVHVGDDGLPIEYIRRGQFPAKSTPEDIVFYRVEGMPSALEGVATHTSHPWYIVDAASFNSEHIQTDKPRGVTHRHVVWNTDNHPSNYADGRLYIAKAFLLDA